MILIGNPGNKRTAALQAARLRLGLPPALVLSYLDLLTGRTTLEQAADAAEMTAWAGDEGAEWSEGSQGAPLWIRLDAFGEEFRVERELIALGAPDGSREEQDDRLLPCGAANLPEPLSARSARALSEQQGRLYHPSQWFRGYVRLLSRLEREAAACLPEARWYHPPEQIVAMFDKRRTHRILSAADVPVPRLLAPPAALPGYGELLEAMRSKRMHRVFIKLAAGSGASGVIAYQLHPSTGAEVAITTVGVERNVIRPPVFYNSIKLRRYTDTAVIRPVIDWLLAHGAHVEQWLPKATHGSRAFDIRQLVAGGAAAHSIARVSRTPITNLHLRSERMGLPELGLADSVQAALRSCAEQAVSAFPGAQSAGVDVLLRNGSLEPCILDVNPFGDLLYGVRYRGWDAYEWQMRLLAGREGEDELDP
ncbi:STM4014 family protein [Paenibacillus puerhi]|uniref:STM4014 family protein n=1 Tax=Paenibacillus puerhi TaxID=2692622 RepID=UPI002E2AC124|nr:STM4014 family protein [Paenibacillus puerhi]